MTRKNRRFLASCGVVAPLLFVFLTILGGALRPGYSHLTNTISELFSPGAPNRLFLSALHTLYAVLLVLFGVGVFMFVRSKRQSQRSGLAGASAYIAMGVVSIATASIFPQDAWGSPPTFYGQMHILLHGVITLLSILSISLIGIWAFRSGISPAFMTYSFVTILAALVMAGMFAANQGGPLMGLYERLAALVGFQWTMALAVLILKRT